MIARAASTGVPLSTMVVLMLSVFTVSMGYGIVLPLLPYLIERLLGTDVDAAQVSRSTGLLTGLYTLSLFSSLRHGGACPTGTDGASFF
jgi:hypothetical protein